MACMAAVRSEARARERQKVPDLMPHLGQGRMVRTVLSILLGQDAHTKPIRISW